MLTPFLVLCYTFRVGPHFDTNTVRVTSSKTTTFDPKQRPSLLVTLYKIIWSFLIAYHYSKWLYQLPLTYWRIFEWTQCKASVIKSMSMNFHPPYLPLICFSKRMHIWGACIFTSSFCPRGIRTVVVYELWLHHCVNNMRRCVHLTIFDEDQLLPMLNIHCTERM